MMTKLFPLLLLLTVVGCSKSNPDPRDQYVGSYQMSGTASSQTGTSAPITSVISNAGTFTITKTADVTGILLVDDGSGSTDATRDKYPATLSSNTFVIPKYTTSIDPGTTNGTRVALEITGSGSFVGNTILVNLKGGYVYNGKGTTFTAVYNGTKL